MVDIVAVLIGMLGWLEDEWSIRSSMIGAAVCCEAPSHDLLLQLIRPVYFVPSVIRQLNRVRRKMLILITAAQSSRLEYSIYTIQYERINSSIT